MTRNPAGAAAKTPPLGASCDDLPVTGDPAEPTVLILGGTGEARALAEGLDALGGVRVLSSLAGRVARPRLPIGEVRIGGFGGPERLAEWLRDEGVACVVDATHPFAQRISASAAQASEASGVPLLRLQRPGWTERPGDDWRWVDSLDEAAALLPALPRRGRSADHDGAAQPGETGAEPVRAFLTTGRQGLGAFRDCADTWFLVRCVDPPDQADLPPRHELLLDRGPYTLAGELDLIDRHQIDVIATKDSGGDLTVAKLDAARERGLPVVVVRRPAGPDVPTVDAVGAAVDWAAAQLSG